MTRKTPSRIILVNATRQTVNEEFLRWYRFPTEPPLTLGVPDLYIVYRVYNAVIQRFSHRHLIVHDGIAVFIAIHAKFSMLQNLDFGVVHQNHVFLFREPRVCLFFHPLQIFPPHLAKAGASDQRGFHP